MSQTLRLPLFPDRPLKLSRSGLRWLVRAGDPVRAREPIAYCNLEFAGVAGEGAARLFSDETRDLQLVLAPREAGVLQMRAGFSSQGAWLELLGSSYSWDSGAAIAELVNGRQGESELLYYFVAARRGFEAGEGRGGLLSGWHDRVRAFWPGATSGPVRTLLALGTCEHLPIIRGEKHAFADWFATSPGPAQVVLHTDDRLVHSSAILLQQLRRTPQEARDLLAAIQAELASAAATASDEAFHAFVPEARRGVRSRRTSLALDLLIVQNQVGESMTASPALEQLDRFGPEGASLSAPPELILLSAGSEYPLHFRHRKTGWLVAMHAYRIEEFGPAGRAWLRDSFEMFRRTHAEVEADLAALALELRERTGAQLLISNFISTAKWARIPNYGWTDDGFLRTDPVFLDEANAVLDRLARRGLCTVVDQDAVAAEHGARHAFDRTHASGPLPAAVRAELLSLLRERGELGF